MFSEATSDKDGDADTAFDADGIIFTCIVIHVSWVSRFTKTES